VNKWPEVAAEAAAAAEVAEAAEAAAEVAAVAAAAAVAVAACRGAVAPSARPGIPIALTFAGSRDGRVRQGRPGRSCVVHTALTSRLRNFTHITRVISALLSAQEGRLDRPRKLRMRVLP
jgi:hypothetical protein